MNNAQALKFWERKKQEAVEDPYCVRISKKYNKCPVTDAEFILKYADKNSKILDLGSGTGLIVNKLYDKVKFVDCIEPFREFSDYIVKNENVNITNISVLDFETDNKYDMVTVFGLISYFNEDESTIIYKKCLNWLKPNGKMIVKNQFGVNEDVLVTGYSEEQKTEYFSEYRHIDKEVKLLENIGFKDVQKFDIYPPEANRWQNTHFYAIIATGS